MILVTKTSDQTRQRGMYVCMYVFMYVCIFIKLHITAQSGPVILVIPCHSHCVCVCVFLSFILDIKFVGHTSRGHTGGRSHRIFHPPSFCARPTKNTPKHDMASKNRQKMKSRHNHTENLTKSSRPLLRSVSLRHKTQGEYWYYEHTNEAQINHK